MSANRSKRQIAGIVTLLALSSFALFGCGGGSDSASVAATPTRAVVMSTPDNIDEVGGTATYTLDINQAVSVDPSTVLINVHKGLTPIPIAENSPTSDAYQAIVALLIPDKTSSLTAGPQVMTPVPGVKNRFAYRFAFPAPDNIITETHAYYTAKDTQGNVIRIAVTNGTNENHNFTGSP